MQDGINELLENVNTDHQVDGITETGKKEPVTDGAEMGKEDYDNIRDTHLVVAALITTVTFAAGLTLPGGYKSNEGPHQGRALLVRVAAFKTFVITNAFAMALSIAAINVYSVSSFTKRKWELKKQFMWGFYLIQYAMIAMEIASLSGSYAVLMNSSGLAVGVIVVGISCTIANSYVSFRFQKMPPILGWCGILKEKKRKRGREGKKRSIRLPL